MQQSRPGLLPLFRSEAQLAALGVLYVGPPRRWTVTALAERLGMPISTASREISRLVEAGVVVSTVEGRNKLVEANWELPWALELAGMLDKTIGPLAKLADALGSLSGLQGAWIFGSWAERRTGQIGPPPGDVDVLIVGDSINQLDAQVILDQVAAQVGIPVDPYFVGEQEWDNPPDDSIVARFQRGAMVQIPVETARA